MDKHTDFTKCIHCKKCTKHCSFLTKYGLTIGDTERLKELAYHCFLCGECTRVCPKGIDGRQIILDMRCKEVEEDGYALKQDGYALLLLEKKDYIFKNYRKAGSKSILFPGCNFPSFYPKTNAYLSKLLKEKADIDTVYDCCGKPIAELGLGREEKDILNRIQRYIDEHEIEELIVVCQNCYDYFGGRLDVKITTIYEKLLELNIGKKIDLEANIYLPCPDREAKSWMEHIKFFLNKEISYISGVECCGLGGCAIVKERKLALDMSKKLDRQGHKHILTYCGTCAGNFNRQGLDYVYHLLPLILDTNEKPDTKYSLINRAKTKFI